LSALLGEVRIMLILKIKSRLFSKKLSFFCELLKLYAKP